MKESATKATAYCDASIMQSVEEWRALEHVLAAIDWSRSGACLGHTVPLQLRMIESVLAYIDGAEWTYAYDHYDVWLSGIRDYVWRIRIPIARGPQPPTDSPSRET